MVGLFDSLARLHRMYERTWQRHANPWSVWTRVPIGPLLVLAIYARLWIGWWCLLPVALLVLWASGCSSTTAPCQSRRTIGGPPRC